VGDRARYIQRKIGLWLGKIYKLLKQGLELLHHPIFCLAVVFSAFLLFCRIDSTNPFQKTPLLSEDHTKSFFDQRDFFVFTALPVSVNNNSLRSGGPVNIVNAQVLGYMDSGLGLGEARKGDNEREIFEYRVKQGDTASLIAEELGISLNTILWANNLTNSSKLKLGQKLIILPVSGAMHLVGKGETLGYLSGLYKADMQEISEFNELQENNKIVIGDLLIIPGGIKPILSVSTSRPIASSYFICPIPGPCTLTQGLHSYNAVDLSHGRCGEPVYAASGGEVQKIGQGTIAGKYVRVLHKNGVVTFYGHLSQILVYAGQPLNQGQVIGYVGNTGYTIGPTGCHVHFEVRGARNPFAY